MIDLRIGVRNLALVGLCLVGLQGCVEFAVGSAVVGTLAATDRRTLGAQTEDKAIVLKGVGRVGNLVGNNGNVNLNSFNRRVLITGEVKDQALLATVEREVRAVEGVQTVVNELTIGGASSLTARSNDSLITGKVKAALVDAKDIHANNVKVVTENSIVYLMGRVSQREGNLAAEAASTVGGVRKVIKVFEYLTDEEFRQFDTRPQSGGIDSPPR